MCTAFVYRGKDVIYGMNMDINEGAFPYDVYMSKDWFCIGCPVTDMEKMAQEYGGPLPAFYCASDGIRKIHGVNSRGVFAACLNNMAFQKAPFRLAEDAYSIDQLMDDLISGRLSLEKARLVAETMELVSLPPMAVDVPDPGFHSLSADASGKILILEPGNGYAVIREKYAAMTNFSLLELPADLNGEKERYYGKDRYDTALGMLRQSGEDFSPEDGLKVLEKTKQTGFWGTRVSFVYSCSQKTVYYCREGNFAKVETHRF